jgi:hypothetical protein
MMMKRRKGIPNPSSMHLLLHAPYSSLSFPYDMTMTMTMPEEESEAENLNA